MARIVHRKLQQEQDFRSVRNYRKKIPAELLDTINGADHSKFLLEKLEKEGNYMSKKNGHRRNLMTIERLLSRIARHANEPEKRLKEAQAFIKSTFPKVQGMVTKDKSSPKLVIRVLVDCFDEIIDCDHREYSKEQNIGLHDVIHPAAMAWVTATGTYVVDSIPTTVRVDRCLLSILCLHRLSPSCLEQSRPDAPQSHHGVRVAGLLLCSHAGRSHD